MYCSSIARDGLKDRIICTGAQTTNKQIQSQHKTELRLMFSPSLGTSDEQLADLILPKHI